MNTQFKQSKAFRQFTQGLTVFLTLILMLLLCYFLYRFDNQYTSTCQQPLDGVLDLREAPLLDNESSPYHLQTGWEFYPDVLLTPEDDFSLYPHSIRSLHESVKGLWEGQGTYRLTVLLPDTPMSYVLKLPTTFSTYRLYVDEELILSMGRLAIEDNPRDFFTNRILTFRASGEVQILLQYSDETGIGLSGLSAPPILGRPLRIYALSEYHRSFLVISMVLILLAMLLSINLYFQSRQGSNLAMIVLSISAAAYLTFPLLSSEILFPIYPWYQLGVLFYFSCHAAAQWVYSLHFGWKDSLSRFINWYSIAAVGISIGLLLESFYLPGDLGGHLLYVGIRILQWGSILCGIALSWRVVQFAAPSRLMGAGSVALWAFMLFDLIVPDFSPVVSARFPVLGIIALMDISILVDYLDVASAHHFRLLYAQRFAHAEQLLKLEERHYAQLSDQVEDVRRIRHDLRQHLRVIRTLLDQEDSAAIAAYLEQYLNNVQPLMEASMMFYHVPIVDALLAYYWSAAQKQNAEFVVTGQLQELPQSVYVDFCSIMGNLLENAMEALARQEPAHPKWIHVRCEIFQKKLMLEVVNSNTTSVHQEDSRFHSSKRDELGTGTLSVSIIAQQYGGFASFIPEEDHFTAQVLLPLSGIDGKGGGQFPA